MSKFFGITVEGAKKEVIPGNGKKLTLKEMQAIVGGYIERVVIPKVGDMYVDEEGLLKGKPVNQMASLAAGRMIVGDVLIVRRGK
jgi:hypothetical protein